MTNLTSESNLTNPNYFIKVSNEFINEESSQHMSENELYLYMLIRRNKSIDNIYYTTPSLISDISNIKIKNRKDRNISDIKDALISMHSKNILNITTLDGENLISLKGNDGIKIEFIEPESKGHVQVAFDDFDSFETLSDIYIHTATARWKGSYFKCSYDRWSNILGCKRRTAISKIDSAVEKGIIYKNIGDYINNSETKQNVNLYSIYPFSDKEKTNMTKNKETIDANQVFRKEINPFALSKDDKEIAKAIEVFKTYEHKGKSIYPDIEEYVIYMMIKDNIKLRNPSKIESKLISAAQERIEELKDNAKFKYKWNKASIEYSSKKLNNVEDLF